MKLMLAMIRPTKLRPVQEALRNAGVRKMTVYDVHGFGRQHGQTEMYRGYEYETHLMRKVALEIAVNDDFVERVVDVLETVARTGPEGSIGDGKVFVLPLEQCYRIGDNLAGPQAIS